MSAGDYDGTALDLRTVDNHIVSMRRFGAHSSGGAQIRFGVIGPAAGFIGVADYGPVLTPDEAEAVGNALIAAAAQQRAGLPGYELPVRP